MEREFDRFGAIAKVEFLKGDVHAYVLYETMEAAIDAWNGIKGVQLGGKKLKVDYASEDRDEAAEPQANGTKDRNARRRSPSRSRVRLLLASYFISTFQLSLQTATHELNESSVKCSLNLFLSFQW